MARDGKGLCGWTQCRDPHGPGSNTHTHTHTHTHTGQAVTHTHTHTHTYQGSKHPLVTRRPSSCQTAGDLPALFRLSRSGHRASWAWAARREDWSQIQWGLSFSYDSIHASPTLVNRIHYPIIGDKSKRLMSLGFSSLIDIGINIDTCIHIGIDIDTCIDIGIDIDTCTDIGICR